MTHRYHTCPECEHQNLEDATNCEQCQAVLNPDVPKEDDARPATKPVADDKLKEVISTVYIAGLINKDEMFNTGKALMQGDLILKVQGTEKKYHIPHKQLQEVVLGRRNPDTGYVPTVDLAEVNGHKYGVSRRHATITRRDSLMVLIDHTSVNGTFLNGKRLVPEQPRVIRDSDMIRLGKLEITVQFLKASQELQK